MAPQSRSPPRQRRSYGGENTGRYGRRDELRNSYSTRNGHEAEENNSRGYGRRSDDQPERQRDGGRGKYDTDGRGRGDYDGQHRAREREDRSYDTGRRAGHRDRIGAARRSASPPSRVSRPRSDHRPNISRSVSGSRSASPVDKAKPNFAQSGLLAAATNSVRASDGTSTILKYNEPPEARKPVLGWRLYVFKGNEQVELLHIHRQSAYLIGRDRMVADISVDHPSCSKQHAVIQYRHVHEKDELGNLKSVVKPFIIDLESTNGTHVNDEAIPQSRFYELKAGDVIKFGQSTREYVLLHDDAA